MDRAQRRKVTATKFATRAKLWFRLDHRRDSFDSWVDMADRERWMKMLKHGKLYGRSTMNNMEKHKAVKAIRKQSKQMARTFDVAA